MVRVSKFREEIKAFREKHKIKDPPERKKKIEQKPTESKKKIEQEPPESKKKIEPENEKNCFNQ
jgi:hypothetical protein